jgi:ATP/ADP translocase
MVKPYMVDLGYDVKEIGFISGILALHVGALMTVPAGIFIRKVGLNKAVWVFPTVNLIAALFFFGLTFTSHPFTLYIQVSDYFGALMPCRRCLFIRWQ